MISRIMLSLRKSTALQQSRWSVWEATEDNGNIQSTNLSRLRRGPNGEGDNVVSVGTYPNP